MLDIALIRERPDFVASEVKARGYDIDIGHIVRLDKEWRALKFDDDSLRSERNKVSLDISEAKKKHDDKRFSELLIKAKEIPLKLSKNEERENSLREEIDKLLSLIPNIQDKSVPRGDASHNKVVHTKGKIRKIANPKSHLEIGEALDILDIKRATNMSGSGFYILKGAGAKLQRALIQFFLDTHIKNGFLEINPPQLVSEKTMFGTGQLPKFYDDLYRTNDGLFLIPTSEVPVTNIYSGEVLNESDLPKRFTASTQCYRTEVGRKAGEEGLFRIHQFEKVEMVYLCRPEESFDMLEEMTGHAEKLLSELGLPYRRLLLAVGDAGFSSAKTYDLEVWSPHMNRWLETSSCSNCTDFQARRMNCRYQSRDGLKFVHTLNGSGLALPRLMISLIENNQQKDGSINIPKVLWKYTGFKKISPKVSKKPSKSSRKKK